MLCRVQQLVRRSILIHLRTMWAFRPVEAASKTPGSLETSLRVMITVVSLGLSELSALEEDASLRTALASR